VVVVAWSTGEDAVAMVAEPVMGTEVVVAAGLLLVAVAAVAVVAVAIAAVAAAAVAAQMEVVSVEVEAVAVEAVAQLAHTEDCSTEHSHYDHRSRPPSSTHCSRPLSLDGGARHGRRDR
jgi:opacity protein-like surface antigen